MFFRHYQSELAYLRDLGREFASFASQHSASANYLLEKSDDPDVERLLQGVAFLTAKIQKRANDAVPSIIHALTELLHPQLLRTTPASSIVQFESVAGGERAVLQSPPGSEVASRATRHQVQCRFRTTAPAELLPLSFVSASVHDRGRQDRALCLELRADKIGRELLFEGGKLTFFLSGSLAQSTTLFLWLANHCKGVSIQEGAGDPKPLPNWSIGRRGFDSDFGLLDSPTFAHPGPRILQEFLALPEKFLFIEVSGIEPRIEGDNESGHIALWFDIQNPPELPEPISARNFRLGCAPVINLFPTPAVPVRNDFPGQARLVRGNGYGPSDNEVYRIDSVWGSNPAGGRRIQYRNFTSFAHVQPHAEVAQYYIVERRHSLADDGIDTYISVHSAQDREPLLTEELLSIELTCTNRSLTDALDVGDLCEETSGSPPGLRFTNITRIHRPARPPLGSELHWRLLSHIGIDFLSLADATRLREVLSLYNFQLESDRHQGRINAQKIASIRTVTTRPLVRLIERIPVRGLATQIDVDVDKFDGDGDAFLFGCVLDRFLAAYLPINTFNALTLRLLPTLTEFSWTPRTGQRPLL